MWARTRIVAGVSIPILLYCAFGVWAADGVVREIHALVCALAVAAVILSRTDFVNAGALLITLACAITPWYGFFTDAPDTSAAAELTWLVLTILVAGLAFRLPVFVGFAVVNACVTGWALAANAGIPNHAAIEVMGLVFLVTALTAVFCAVAADHEQRLRAEKAFVEATLAALADAVIVVGGDGLIRAVNPALYWLIGRQSDVLGAPVASILPHDLEVDREYGDALLRATDGSEVPVSARGALMEDSTSTVWVLRDLRETRALLEEAAEAAAHRQKAKELAESNRKLIETQAQLVQAGKLAAVGELSAGIAHDVNNPLTGVLSYAELLRIHLDTPNPDPARSRE